MKSLEDDALKAQLVLTKVKEVEDEYQNKKDHGKFRLQFCVVKSVNVIETCLK